MISFVQVFSGPEMVIKACGRACADMGPATRPSIPTAPPPSMAELMREHPDAGFQPEWLAAMETDPTLH